MGQFFDTIPEFLFPWIKQQKIFWIATAPLSEDGNVNVSPKGYDRTFHIVNEKQVWYEDLTGSGVETISHLKENGRITVMFSAFEGPPRICRLFGKGTVYEFGTPEYEALLPVEKRLPGSRSVIVVDVHKVGTSCGFSTPFFTFKSHRMKLHNFSIKVEQSDIDAEASCLPSELDGQPRSNNGLKAFWKSQNVKSIDGLTGIEQAYASPVHFHKYSGEGNGIDDEHIAMKDQKTTVTWRLWNNQLVLGFILGVVINMVYGQFRKIYF
ncbi:hypothetical protein BDQ12DRAFT_360097 [Crucibulum laeve]|uniref:Pyridoxamine 5'-phosphate oxidase N-terminal domain-containing protein n=1 Tax=Crucibulum laeve TaxID=68775 RepID=A0A5C3LN87_9AGAR|nr:hypothetical protein BDQ12DRAFT_360097 [Crucibulum laeve]